MLVTDMWQRNEHSRNLYAPETSERADDEDPPSWESRFAQVLRTEGHPCATLTGTSSIPGIGRARVASGWQDYRNSSHGRSCSTPPHGRMNPSFAETLSVKYHPYHDASTVGRHDHQVAAFGTRAIDSAEGHGDSSLGHNKAVAFDEVMTARERMSNCQHDSEISSKNDAAYLGENQPGNFTGRPHVGELPRMSNVDPNGPINHREAGIVLGHLHTKSRSRNNLVDLGPGNQDVRSDFRIEKMAFSSSETHLSLPYQEASGLHSGFKNHGMESYPRRYSSVLDNTPVIVHQYEENKYQTHGRSKRSSIPVHFPPAAAASKHASKDNYSIKDSANRRQRCHQSSPQLDLESEIRRRRSADISGTSHFPSHRFSDSNKESLLHFPPASAGGSSTTASSPCADHGSLPTSSPASLPPLTPTSPHLAVPTASIPKSLSRPPNELSDSSFTSAAETSQPSSPSKPRATLARSHVPKKHSSKDLCVICGDKASGYHYNTLSCEGCKGFFRRTITRNLHYHCKYGGNCVMDMWMRRKCPACRLKRCKQVGMREECLLTEHQCVIRNTRRRMKMRKKEEETEVQPKSESSDISPDDTQAILASLNSDHKDLIERLVNLQDKYELPSDEDLKLLKEDKMYNAPSQEDLSDAIFVHMVEMTILVTRLIVEFAKSLPGFRNLVKEDQIVLLKSSSSEVMMLRTARRYNSETNTIIFGNGVPFSPSSMAFGGLQESVESLFNFSRSMSSLYVDNAEYALLTAMCIFSVRSGLTNPSVVDKLQEVYMDVLIAYVGKRRSKCQNYLAKLLMKFVHLRTLGHEHSRTLYNLTLKKGSLPPLLTEYFDISE